MRTKDLNNQSHWNTKWMAEGKDTWRKYHKINAQELEFISNNSKLIDLGCGNGYFLGQVKEKKNNMVLMGLDISSVGIAQLNEFYGIPGMVSKLPEIPYPIEADSFDYVVMNELMEHVVDEKGLLNNAFRICKSGGWIIVAVPENHSPEYKQFIEHEDSEHVRWYDKTKLFNCLNRLGTNTEIFDIDEEYQVNGNKNTGKFYVARTQKK